LSAQRLDQPDDLTGRDRGLWVLFLQRMHHHRVLPTEYYWKLVLSGSPERMRYMVYGFGGYAMVNFAIFFFQMPQGGSGANPPAMVWRGFSATG